MAHNSTPMRDYNFRHRGDSTKFSANSEVFKTKCNNCTSFSIENDRLRRQIAILSKHIEQSAVNIPLSDSASILVPELCSVESTGTQTSNHVADKCSGPDSLTIGDGNFDHDASLKFANLSGNGLENVPSPYYNLSQGVLKSVNTSKLDRETDYSHKFHSRSVAYYGEFPYAYTGGFHKPRPLSDNPYLASVLDQVRLQFPSLEFNSAMITRYMNGQQGIPFHSDNEEFILPDSMICTISLGETRTLKFRSKNKKVHHTTETKLSHGDVLLMTKVSQNFFEHNVPKNMATNMRLSITLRQIDGNLASSVAAKHNEHLASEPNMSASKSIQNSSNPNEKRPPNNRKSLCVYISSSMFSKLDGKKLSSKYQEAHVFHYPGATASGINERFQADERKDSLNADNVKNIVLMCATNDVDSILKSPRYMRDKLLSRDNFKCDARALDSTNNSIENCILSLHKWAPDAQIRIVNVLPRESYSRNKVISDINLFISKMPMKHSFVSFISTEKDRFLFSNKFGFRKSSCFRFGEDNVHLNHEGIVKLAKHVKYHAHH